MAGPTRASGQPDYSSGSTSGFIPEIWSGKLVEKLYSATVFGEIANTDYEGEISKKGDTVNIRTTPSMVIRDYEIGGGLTYDKPTSDKVTLEVNRAKYFAFEVNDIDAYQSDLRLMDNWSDDGGEQMKIAIDTDMLGSIYADAAAANKGATAGAISGGFNLGVAGTPVALTKANILDYIVDCGTVLDEQNMPETGRWMVLPAWACGLIKKSDLKDASISGDGTSILRNGRLGGIDRFILYSSNNISHVTDTYNVANIVFGHKKGVTFASQMTNMETLPNPNDFGKLVRGLNVYGYETIDANAVGHLYAYKSA